MGTLEEVKRMQSEGKSEADIVDELRARGASPDEISSAVIQARIKSAVGGDSVIESEQMSMQPSVMGPEPIQESSAPAPVSEYSPQQYPAQDYPSYPQEQQMAPQEGYYQGSVSPDTISEIAEQVIQEKIKEISNKVQQHSSFKSLAEAKLESLDERLKRIEKIIDKLQMSIIQKIGEYGTSIEDLKKEVVETQKTFKSVVDKHHSSSSSK
jgi:hypothetical protein